MKFVNGKIYKIKDNTHIMNLIMDEKIPPINFLIYREKSDDFTHPAVYPQGLFSGLCVKRLIDDYSLELNESK